MTREEPAHISEHDHVARASERAKLNSQDGKSRIAFVAVLIGALGILIVTAPSFYYSGDTFVPRAEAAYFLNTGEFGIPYAHKEELSDFVRERGQYFFEHDGRERFFSKYGIAYTLLYLVPMQADKMVAGNVTLLDSSGTLLLLLNLFNLCFSAVIIVYLWKLASLYTRWLWLRVSFVFASLFGTFAWFYLRAFAHDIFQLAAFLGFVYHALAYIRYRRCSGREDLKRLGWVSLLASGTCLGLLVHMRFSYALLYLPLGMLWFTAGSSADTLRERIRENLTRDAWKHAVAYFLPLAIAIGGLLLAQWWKFGSPWNHGYAQWGNVSVMHRIATWPLATVGKTLLLYFVSPGNGNVFLHYPLVAVGVLGLCWGWRGKYREEWLFLVGCFALTLLPVLRWGTEGYGYGPRYLLPALMVLSLPGIVFTAWLVRQRDYGRVLRPAWAACVLLPLLWSCRMQVYMNSLPYFAYYYIAEVFEPAVENQAASVEMRRYLHPIHRGYIHRDLIADREGERELPALQILLESLPAEQRVAKQPELREYVNSISCPNYMFLARRAATLVRSDGR